jgi:hypothetical protein
VLRSLETLSGRRYVPSYAMALVNAGLDERDAALKSLDRAYAMHDVHLMFLLWTRSGIRIETIRAFRLFSSVVDSRGPEHWAGDPLTSVSQHQQHRPRRVAGWWEGSRPMSTASPHFRRAD